MRVGGVPGPCQASSWLPSTSTRLLFEQQQQQSPRFESNGGPRGAREKPSNHRGYSPGAGERRGAAPHQACRLWRGGGLEQRGRGERRNQAEAEGRLSFQWSRIDMASSANTIPGHTNVKREPRMFPKFFQQSEGGKSVCEWGERREKGGPVGGGSGHLRLSSSREGNGVCRL